MVSLAGEAVMRLPAIVPRLRICGAPIGARAIQFRFDAMVVRHERTEVDDPVFVHCDFVEVGDARHVYDGFDSLADAAFEFEN